MDFLHIVMPIIIGGVIGYFTNYIAIKMMFHPRKAVFIGKHKLPFTPGIIPKNQKRIARAVGDAVSEQLLTEEAILDRVMETSDKSISKLVDEILVSDLSVNEVFSEKTADDALIDSISDTVANAIIKRVDQADIDSLIRDFGEKTVSSITADKPLLAMVFNADVKNAMFSITANAVRDYINEHGEEKLKEFVSNHIREFSRMPLKDIVKSEDSKGRINDTVKRAVESMIKNHGAALLAQIDIRHIVAERIEAMKPEELEELVLSVMKQELQAVINLGAVIGAIIGIINIFI